MRDQRNFQKSTLGRQRVLDEGKKQEREDDDGIAHDDNDAVNVLVYPFEMCDGLGINNADSQNIDK